MLLHISILVSAALASVAPPAPASARSVAHPPVVTVHAKDFSYAGPKTIKSGATTFRLVNDGKELHHLTLLKLAKGKTMADFAEAMKKHGPPPAWATDVGGPNPAVPGGAAEATLTLDAGEYVMICFIPSPGETMPHAMKGMMGSLTVLRERSAERAAKGDVTIRLSDYKFGMAKPLTAGKHLINVVNDAQQSHEVVIIMLKPGKTMADMGEWIDKQLMKGEPPGMPLGGIAALAKGRSGTFPVDLKPGKYGLICFVPDAKDGKPHSQHGMVMELAVK